MKHLPFTILAFCLILLIAGCQPGKVRNNQKIDYSPIAGTWKAEEGVWQVTISKEGKVVSVIHPLGTVEVKPNKTVYAEMKDGSQSSYTGGDFTLIYDPDRREMEVTIKMEKIHVKYLDNEIIGTTETIIGGYLSGDFMVWDVDMLEIFDYGPRFPQNEEDIIPIHREFHKISN